MSAYRDKLNCQAREGEAPAEPEYAQIRKHPQHGVVVSPAKPTIVLLTVCTQQRDSWLTTPEVHDLLDHVWREAAAWMVGKYIIMPDHVHLFAGVCDQRLSLESWVKYWKSQFSKLHKNRTHRWQTDHWDRRIRSAAQYLKKWEYVSQNPVRHGLVDDADRWPYQGEIHSLVWNGIP